MGQYYVIKQATSVAKERDNCVKACSNQHLPNWNLLQFSIIIMVPLHDFR